MLNMNDSVSYRLVRGFAFCQRIQDLQLITNLKLHYASYGKLGDTNERLLRDLENRYSLDVTKWENHWEEEKKKAVANYISITQMPVERTEIGVEKEKTEKPTTTTSKK